MKRLKLTLSSDYVAHWGMWEAIRELIQNAYDQRDSSGCGCTIEVTPRGDLRIANDEGYLDRQSLLMGHSTKCAEDRGQFGEGYKLALLVLCRMGCSVVVYNGTRKWEVSFRRDEDFGCKVLCFDEYDMHPPETGVAFVVSGLSRDGVEELLSEKLCNEPYGILEMQRGRIYVGGLWVCDKPDFEHGYNLDPGTVRLDRDRQAVADFDLSCVTSSLWERRGGAELYRLLKDKAPDVKYINATEETAEEVATRFEKAHGDAVPVSTQHEIQRATASGKRFVLVSDKVRQIIAKVREVFIPASGGPLEKLEVFLERYQWRLDTEMKCELDDIVETLKSQRCLLSEEISDPIE